MRSEFMGEIITDMFGAIEGGASSNRLRSPTPSARTLPRQSVDSGRLPTMSICSSL